MKQIVIDVRIPMNGQTSIHVAGAQGGSCETLTQAIERRLGTVEAREYTPERESYVSDSAPNQQTVRRT